MAIMNNRGHGFLDLENRYLCLSSVTSVVALFGVVALFSHSAAVFL
jgi:hypothetical protein